MGLTLVALSMLVGALIDEELSMGRWKELRFWALSGFAAGLLIYGYKEWP
jgi:hypothetical protein